MALVAKLVNCIFHNICLCLQEKSCAILAHLPSCERLTVCLYSGTACALHLRQTCAM